MIRPRLRLLSRAVGGLVAGMAVVVLLAAWRLASGPISLGFATPLIEDFVNDDGAWVQWRIDDAVVSWGGLEDGFDVRLLDVRAVDGEDRTLLRAPELSARLSIAALSHGVVAPETIRVHRPTLKLRRDEHGIALQVPGDEGPSGLGGADLQDLLVPASPDAPAIFVRQIEFIDADLAVDDTVLALPWRAHAQHVRLWREGSGIKGEAQLTFHAGGETADVIAIGEYEPARETVDLAVSFADARPALLAALLPGNAYLQGVETPVDGTVTLALDNAGDIISAVFDVATDGGTIRLPGAGSGSEGPASWSKEPVVVTSGRARGHFQEGDDAVHLGLVELLVRHGNGGSESSEARLAGHGRIFPAERRYELDDAVVEFGDRGSVMIPPPVDHRLPLRSVRLRARFLSEDKRLVVEDLNADLRGPRVAASAVVEGWPKVRTSIEAKLADLNVDDLADYWPRSLGTGAHRWVTAHLSEGAITGATLSADLRADENGVAVEEISGTMALAGVSVDYLPPLPPVVEASGTATFDSESFTVRIADGATEGLEVREGTARFAGLSGGRETAAIDLEINGGLGDVFRLIDKPPLGYASEVGIDPDRLTGQATIRLRVDFPLIGGLALKDVSVEATAEARDVNIRDVLMGEDLRSAALALEIDKEGVAVAGDAQVGSVAGNVEAYESFGSGEPFRRRIAVTVPKANVDDVRRALLDAPVVAGDAMGGALAADVRITEFADGDGEFTATLDLTDAFLAFPWAGWEKTPGEEAAAQLKGRFHDRSLTELAFSASGRGESIALSGSARFDPERNVRRIAVDRLVLGRTDTGGVLSGLAGGGWDLSIKGRSLDLSSVINGEASPDGEAFELIPEGADRDPLRLRLELDTLWLAGNHPLTDLTASAVRENGGWSSARARARVGDGSRLSAVITQQDDRGGPEDRRLLITADDAGATLRTLGLFPDMSGGRLTLTATLPDAGTGPLKGRLHIRDYHVKDAPLVARMLSMMALTGIDDALRGDGLPFSILDAPFVLDEGILDIADARASGSSIGLTASGEINLTKDLLAIEGTVVPLFVINGNLGRIPLLGPMLSGGERGGGLFAATYRMTGTLDEPDVSVNALAALAPSYLRELFDGFGNGDEADEGDPPALPNDKGKR